jgi:hypothetical protein
MAKSGRSPHLHTSPFYFTMASMRWSISMDILKKNCYFRNDRVPGQFATCENLPLHRFQFNSQFTLK